MADNSSSSSCSSASSSSSGEIQSPIALLEMIEDAIESVSRMQSYTIGDRKVTYADLKSLMAMRSQLMKETSQRQGTRPIVSESDLTGNF